MRLRLLVGLDQDAVRRELARLPEVGAAGRFLLAARGDALELRRRVDRRRDEGYELLRQQVVVHLHPWRRPGVTEVRARVARRVNAPGVSLLLADVVGFAGAHTLVGLLELRATLRARRRERAELLNVVSRALSRHAVSERELDPYRAR